ncbi:MAG: transposase [Gammaproteobacteria bacterium]|nr:transposase [Gammaproteobacteria bacterium]MBU1482683.1 transposase [Gammaproteobacteria bacterium]
MPRRPRVNLAEHPQHVVQRGHNREACFFADEDYLFYLHWLREGAKKYCCDIHAYVLMTNHVHLLLTPHHPDAISLLMQSLGRRYAQYVNRIYRRSGSVWEGRFKASLIQAEAYLMTCYRYIELNPVRAEMVRDPGEYRWSSYRWHGLGMSNELITDHPLYVAQGMEEEARRAAYRALFRAHLDAEALDEIRKATSRSLPLGSERFKEQVEAVLGKRVGLQPRGRREAAPTTIVLPGQLGLDL